MPLDMNVIRARRAELARIDAEREANKILLELEEGDNFIRVLPPSLSSTGWCRKFGSHYKITEKGGLKCPKTTASLPCPVDELIQPLFKSKVQEEKDYAYEVRAKDRFVANVLDLKKNDGKVYVMEFGPGIEKDIISVMDGGGDTQGAAVASFGKGDITDPKNGYDLRITKTVPKDPKQTKYEVLAANSPTPVANWDAIKGSLNDLDAYVTRDMKTYDELVNILSGGTPSADVAPPKQAAETKTATAPGDNFEPPRGSAGGLASQFGSASKPAAETKTAAATQTTPAATAATDTGPNKLQAALAKIKALKKTT